MHWRISRFQELEHLPERDRAKLLRRFMPRGTYATLLLWPVFFGVVAGGIASIVLTETLRLPKELAAPAVVVAAVGSAVATYQLLLIRIRGALLTYLERMAQRQRLPMCLRCGYNLEGVVSDVCPECGTRIHGRRRWLAPPLLTTISGISEA
jgi:uncharacterized paraquat-inducible protein A